MVRERRGEMASLRELGVHNHHFQHHPHHKLTKAPRGGNMVKPILKKLASSPKNSLDLDRGWEEQPVDFGGYRGSAYEAGRASMARSARDVSFQFPSPTWEPSSYGSGARVGAVGGGGEGGGGGRGRGSSAAGSGSGPATPVHVGAGGLGLEAISPSIGGGALLSISTRNLSRVAGRYHVRTPSGTSIATSGSSHRPGASFVHPFQQTPRTNTPPLTYAHSFTSLEPDSHPARDYSPTTITETDDYDWSNPASLPLLSQSVTSTSHLHHHLHHLHRLHHKSAPSHSQSHPPPHSHIQSQSQSHSATSLRGPSLASQRTSSLSDIRGHHQGGSGGSNNNKNNNNNNNNINNNSHGTNSPPVLRVNTHHSTTSTTTTLAANASAIPSSIPRTVPSASSKLSQVSQFSHMLSTSDSNSDLALNHTTTNNNTATISPSASPRPSIQLASPSTSSTTAPMSPLRTSLEGAFRLRSRSEVETGASRVDIREARRRFEEAERAKQEKYEAEQRRKQERRLEKDRALPLLRKTTTGSEMDGIGGSDRPGFARRRTPPLLVGARRTRSGGSAGAYNEKGGAQPGAAAFMSSNYESTMGGAVPDFGLDVHDVRLKTPPRALSAKRKTQSYWTSFVLWFRTRLLRLGRH